MIISLYPPSESIPRISQNRSFKGKNLITFPQSYTIVDLETTGLSTVYDSIIEVSALKVRNNTIVDTFSSLTGVDGYVYIDDFITELTGITQEMINQAPKISEVLPLFLDFIADDIVVGHNTSFDINFLYDASISILNKPFPNDFIDTMRISRKLYPDWKHHRLSDIASYYSIVPENFHRALSDCQTTFSCFQSLITDISKKYGSCETFCQTIKRKRSLHASDIVTTNINFDESHPLFGKVCVFTGKLEKLTRKEAMQLVADLGGINANGVTKNTNFLILGNNDYCSSIKDGKSSKQKKAEKLKLAGQDIDIIPENVFYDFVLDSL